MQTRTERARTSGSRRSDPPSSCTAARSRWPLPPGTAPVPSLRNSAVPLAHSRCGGLLPVGYSRARRRPGRPSAVAGAPSLPPRPTRERRLQRASARPRVGRPAALRGVWCVGTVRNAPRGHAQSNAAAVSLVPVQMWQRWARSRCRRGQGWARCRCRCARGEPSRSADVAWVSPVPVPVQMWEGRAQSQCRCGRGEQRSRCRCGRGELSPVAVVGGASPVAVQMWQG
jgi:hypothetical protein